MLLGRCIYGLGGENMSVAQSSLVAEWFRVRESISKTSQQACLPPAYIYNTHKTHSHTHIHTHTQGKELAFAFGINLSCSRLGSVINNFVEPEIADKWGGACLHACMGSACLLRAKGKGGRADQGPLWEMRGTEEVNTLSVAPSIKWGRLARLLHACMHRHSLSFLTPTPT